MSTLTAKIEIQVSNCKDQIFSDLLAEVLKHGLYAVNCDPEYIDMLDGRDLPRIYLNLDRLTNPVQYVGIYGELIKIYSTLCPNLYGFNVPISGRFMSTEIGEVKEQCPKCKLRGWLYHPIDVYSPQVAEYLNNIEEFGYDEVVLAFKKDSVISDIIITTEQIAKEISVPVKIYHPAAKMADMVEWNKYVSSSGMILDIKSVAF